MFKHQISISINTKHNREELLNEFEFLLASLCQTGQIVKKYEMPYIQDNEIISFQSTPERTSLSKKNGSEYVNRHWNNLEKWCDSKVSVKKIATYPSSASLICKCKLSVFYVLLTHTFNDLSPIECGTCGGVVPIYKLKALTSEERYSIFSWETNYKACDDLQLGCTVGEKWATKQMSDAHSQLSKQGIDICSKISNATNVPVYYYLFNFKHISGKQDNERKCPSCNKEWLLSNPLHGFYNFKCNECHLISSITSNAK